MQGTVNSGENVPKRDAYKAAKCAQCGKTFFLSCTYDEWVYKTKRGTRFYLFHTYSCKSKWDAEHRARESVYRDYLL